MNTTFDKHPSGQSMHGVRVILRVLLFVGEHSYTLGDAEIVCETPTVCEQLSTVSAALAQANADATRRTSGSLPSALLTIQQRQRIATLCQRLGVAEPVYDQLSEQDAAHILTRLQAEEDELLQTAEEAHPPRFPSAEPPLIEKALIRQLKQRWRTHFRPQGELATVVALWETFKTRVCGEPVADHAMRASQYEQLLAALAHPRAERS